MKRRWTILFFIALTPLIGLSWLATKFGISTWSIFSYHSLGLCIATIVAALATVRVIESKWPAGVALVVSLPMAATSVREIGHSLDYVEMFGPSLPLVIFGALATTVASLVILIMPVPPPPQDPPVAPARVVD